MQFNNCFLPIWLWSQSLWLHQCSLKFVFGGAKSNNIVFFNTTNTNALIKCAYHQTFFFLLIKSVNLIKLYFYSTPLIFVYSTFATPSSMCLDRIISAFCVHVWTFTHFSLFFFSYAMIVDLIQCEQCTPQQLFQHILINFSTIFQSWDPQTSLFNNFFIKNGSHGTIYTFKNYFAIVSSVFSFNKISSIQTDPQDPILKDEFEPKGILL